jgi:pimeloyl-ACP methyl ester carboxylesterase
MFELDLLHTSVGGFAKYIHKFLERRGYNDYHLLGNSLGGHIALVHILKHPEKVKTLISTGSSGLYEERQWVIHIRAAVITSTSRRKPN